MIAKIHHVIGGIYSILRQCTYTYPWSVCAPPSEVYIHLLIWPVLALPSGKESLLRITLRQRKREVGFAFAFFSPLLFLLCLVVSSSILSLEDFSASYDPSIQLSTRRISTSGMSIHVVRCRGLCIIDLPICLCACTAHLCWVSDEED